MKDSKIKRLPWLIGLFLSSVILVGCVDRTGEQIANLSSSDPAVRGDAVVALRDGDPEPDRAVPALLEQLRIEEDPVLRSMMAYAVLSMEPRPEALVSDLMELSNEASPALRRTIFGMLEEMGPQADAARPVLRESIASDENLKTRRAAARALAAIAPKQDVDVWLPVIMESIRVALRSDDPYDPDAIRELVKLLEPHGDKIVPITPELVILIGDENNHLLRTRAAVCLDNIGPRAIAPLVNALSSKTPMRRRMAAGLLGTYGSAAGPEVYAALKNALNDPDPVVRRNAKQALEELGK